MQLSATQVQQYDDQGFLILGELMPAPLRGEILENASRLAAAATYVVDNDIVKWDQRVKAGEVVLRPEDRELGVFKLHHPYRHDAYFHGLLGRMPELPVARQLLGPELKCITQQLIMKPAGHGQWQPYHQDAYYFEYEPTDGCAVWTALDAATIENGCLWVVPGSHRGPVLPHEKPDVANINAGFLEAQGFDKDKGIAVELPSGAAVLFHNKLLHMSGPNRSAHRRRALVTHYANANWTYRGDFEFWRIP